MTKKIKRKELNEIINSINTLSLNNSKNIFGLRCEKVGKKIGQIANNLNEEILDINCLFASTDKDGNILHEKVTTSNNHGSSKEENSGNFKYTYKKDQERKEAIEEFWKEDVEIPINVITRGDKYNDLYKKIIQESSFTTLTALSGIILDIPLDGDGFIDEEWVLNFLSSEAPKEELNGKSNAPKLEATVTG